MAKPSWNDLTAEQFHALLDYASKNGKDWKDRLCADWANGRDSTYLRQIRNKFGPSWLSGLPYPRKE